MEFHVFKDKAGTWRWRLMREREILVDSAYGFTDKADCLASLEVFRSISPSTPIFED